MLCSFVFDTIHSCFEDLCVLVHLPLAFLSELSIDLGPVPRIFRLMWFLFPVGNISLDKLPPQLFIVSTELWGSFLKFSLCAMVSWCRLKRSSGKNTNCSGFSSFRRIGRTKSYGTSPTSVIASGGNQYGLLERSGPVHLMFFMQAFLARL